MDLLEILPGVSVVVPTFNHTTLEAEAEALCEFEATGVEEEEEEEEDCISMQFPPILAVYKAM